MTPNRAIGLGGSRTLPEQCTFAPEDLAAVIAARPLSPPPPAPAQLGCWQRWRGLLDTAWDARNRIPRRLHWSALSLSTVVNLLLLLGLLLALYVRFGPTQPPAAEEGVRIRITGFGIPGMPGGGQPAADGDGAVQASVRVPSDASANARVVSNAQAASANSSWPMEASTVPASGQEAREAASLPQVQESVQAHVESRPTEQSSQPLNVSTERAELQDFRLPPMQLPALVAATPKARDLPAEAAIPAPLSVPAVRLLEAPVLAAPQWNQPALRSEQAIPSLPQNPEIKLRTLATPELAGQVQPLQERALPAPAILASVEPASSDAKHASAASDTAPARQPLAASTGMSGTRTPGLPQSRGQSASPGMQAANAGAGPAQLPAAKGWPSPQRGDDWGLGDRNQAGQAQGQAAQGRGNAQGGRGLWDAEGRPRLADDRFAARFPDPYKEGSWLRRPQMDTRGTMFDGIWRPPENLLEEWVRRGIKSTRIPIPGTNMELECVVSLLQAAGGCLPVAGKNGHFDQPARARAAPDVPFKPELFEAPEQLSPSTAEPASTASEARPLPKGQEEPSEQGDQRDR